MERLKRYNKQIVAVMSALVVFVGGVLSTSFQSHAYYFQGQYYHSEPPVSDGSGWFALLLRNKSTGKYVTKVYTVQTLATDTSYGSMDSIAYMTLSPSSVTVGPYGVLSNTANAFVSIIYLDMGGTMTAVHYSQTSALNLSYSGYEICSYKIYGDIMVYSNSIPETTVEWNILFKGGSAVNKFIERIYDSVSDISTNGLTNVEMAIDDLYNMLQTQGDDTLYEMDVLSSQLDDITNYLTDVVDVLEKNLGVIVGDLSVCRNTLNQCKDVLFDILEEQKKSNTWLEKIWDSIQEFFNPSEEENTESEKFESETTESSGTINDLNEQNKTEKVDIDSASNSVDENIDVDSIGSYGLVLANITENEYILQMLLMVFAIGLVAYVLFGKK